MASFTSLSGLSGGDHHDPGPRRIDLLPQRKSQGSAAVADPAVRFCGGQQTPRLISDPETGTNLSGL